MNTKFFTTKDRTNDKGRVQYYVRAIYKDATHENGPFDTYEEALAFKGRVELDMYKIKPMNGGKYKHAKAHARRTGTADVA